MSSLTTLIYYRVNISRGGSNLEDIADDPLGNKPDVMIKEKP